MKENDQSVTSPRFAVYHCIVCDTHLLWLNANVSHCREKWYFKNTYIFIVTDDGFNCSNECRLSFMLWFESHIPNLLGLSDSQLCRRCATENETSAHILCGGEALTSHRHAYLGSFFDPEDIIL